MVRKYKTLAKVKLAFIKIIPFRMIGAIKALGILDLYKFHPAQHPWKGADGDAGVVPGLLQEPVKSLCLAVADERISSEVHRGQSGQVPLKPDPLDVDRCPVHVF